MTLVGKIFVVAILIMSVVYMGLALAVYSSHRNWKEVVDLPRDQAGPGKEVGLKYQLEDLKAKNDELKLELDRLQAQIDTEQAAYRQNLAKLETERTELLANRQEMQQQLDELATQNRTLTGTVDSTQQNLTRLTQEVEGLRQEISETQKRRDEIFATLVTETDELHDAHGELQRLQERLNQLTATLGQYKQKLTANGISPDAPVVATTPALHGLVTAVRQNNLIEVSLGSDDGLRVGNTIEVYRDQTYLGRAEVLQTAPDRAVAKLLKDYRRGVVQAGDQVATRLNKVS